MGSAESQAAVGTEPAAQASELALERAFPALAGKLPRVVCTRLPTRVHRLDRLGPACGASELWIKRDDESGTRYGGNKPRKLELLLGAARARGKRSVLTFGGIGTNHGLATAIYAREHGLRTILFLLWQPVTQKVLRGLLECHALGAELHYAESVSGLVTRALWRCALGLARRDLPYVIPTGGSSPLGTLGYVSAALELKEQVGAGLLPPPDWIFVPVGTAGTVAGLGLGCRLGGLPARVTGVLATDILPPTPAKVARLANRAYGLLRRLGGELPQVRMYAEDFLLLRDFVGPGYGVPTEEARRARRNIEELEGIRAETTYTAKCLAALCALAGTPPFRGSRILYWHTYSAVDPSAWLGRLPGYRELPREFHPFFEGEIVSE